MRKNKEIRCENEKTDEEAMKEKEGRECSLVWCSPSMCKALVFNTQNHRKEAALGWICNRLTMYEPINYEKREGMPCKQVMMEQMRQSSSSLRGTLHCSDLCHYLLPFPLGLSPAQSLVGNSVCTLWSLAFSWGACLAARGCALWAEPTLIAFLLVRNPWDKLQAFYQLIQISSVLECLVCGWRNAQADGPAQS